MWKFIILTICCSAVEGMPRRKNDYLWKMNSRFGIFNVSFLSTDPLILNFKLSPEHSIIDMPDRPVTRIGKKEKVPKRRLKRQVSNLEEINDSLPNQLLPREKRCHARGSANTLRRNGNSPITNPLHHHLTINSSASKNPSLSISLLPKKLSSNERHQLIRRILNIQPNENTIEKKINDTRFNRNAMHPLESKLKKDGQLKKIANSQMPLINNNSDFIQGNGSQGVERNKLVSELNNVNFENNQVLEKIKDDPFNVKEESKMLNIENQHVESESDKNVYPSSWTPLIEFQDPSFETKPTIETDEEQFHNIDQDILPHALPQIRWSPETEKQGNSKWTESPVSTLKQQEILNKNERDVDLINNSTENTFELLSALPLREYLDQAYEGKIEEFVSDPKQEQISPTHLVHEENVKTITYNNKQRNIRDHSLLQSLQENHGNINTTFLSSSQPVVNRDFNGDVKINELPVTIEQLKTDLNIPQSQDNLEALKNHPIEKKEEENINNKSDNIEFLEPIQENNQIPSESLTLEKDFLDFIENTPPPSPQIRKQENTESLWKVNPASEKLIFDRNLPAMLAFKAYENNGNHLLNQEEEVDGNIANVPKFVDKGLEMSQRQQSEDNSISPAIFNELLNQGNKLGMAEMAKMAKTDDGQKMTDVNSVNSNIVVPIAETQLKKDMISDSNLEEINNNNPIFVAQAFDKLHNNLQNIKREQSMERDEQVENLPESAMPLVSNPEEHPDDFANADILPQLPQHLELAVSEKNGEEKIAKEVRELQHYLTKEASKSKEQTLTNPVEQTDDDDFDEKDIASIIKEYFPDMGLKELEEINAKDYGVEGLPEDVEFLSVPQALTWIKDHKQLVPGDSKDHPLSALQKTIKDLKSKMEMRKALKNKQKVEIPSKLSEKVLNIFPQQQIFGNGDQEHDIIVNPLFQKSSLLTTNIKTELNKGNSGILGAQQLSFPNKADLNIDQLNKNPFSSHINYYDNPVSNNGKPSFLGQEFSPYSGNENSQDVAMEVKQHVLNSSPLKIPSVIDFSPSENADNEQDNKSLGLGQLLPTSLPTTFKNNNQHEAESLFYPYLFPSQLFPFSHDNIFSNIMQDNPSKECACSQKKPLTNQVLFQNPFHKIIPNEEEAGYPIGSEKLQNKSPMNYFQLPTLNIKPNPANIHRLSTEKFDKLKDSYAAKRQEILNKIQLNKLGQTHEAEGCACSQKQQPKLLVNQPQERAKSSCSCGDSDSGGCSGGTAKSKYDEINKYDILSNFINFLKDSTAIKIGKNKDIKGKN